MSISTIETIMERIKSATFESPIAVFTTIVNGKTALKSVFGDTAKSLAWIKSGRSPDGVLVGVFNRSMKQEDVRRKLITALNSQL